MINDYNASISGSGTDGMTHGAWYGLTSLIPLLLLLLASCADLVSSDKPQKFKYNFHVTERRYIDMFLLQNPG